MGLPGSVTVEVAFGSDPLDAAPVWTDVTQYVAAEQPVMIRRGRQSEVDEVQPGTLSLTFDNADGRFTAGNTASPYYPNVTVNRRIRVSAVESAVTYRLFDGHVDRWPVSWEGGVRSLVSVTATDRTKLLARRPLRTLLEQEVLADEPVVFWPLTESAGADSAGDVSRAGSPYTLTVRDHKDGPGELTFGDDWRMLYSTAPTWNNPVDTSAYSSSQASSFLEANAEWWPTYPWSLEMWVKLGDLPVRSSNDRIPLLWVGTKSDTLASLYVWPTGSADHVDPYTDALYDPVGQVTGYDNHAGQVRLDDGQWHHLVVTSDEAGGTVTQSLYIDAEFIDSNSFAAGAVASRVGAWLWLGGYEFGRGPYEPALVFNGQIARVAVYDTALSAARVQAHYDMGRASFRELSSERVERLAGYAGIPTGTIETGLSQVASDQDTAGHGADQALQEVATSEDGLVFIAGDGTLTFHARSHRQNQAVTATLDASTGQVDADLRFELSDALTANDVSVDRPRSGPVRVVDQTSVDAIGTYAEQLSTILASDSDTRGYAEQRVARRATPQVRAGQVTVDPFTEAALYPTALGTELGSRVRLTNLPASAPASTVDVVVEGIEHTFSADGWRTSWDTSPADESTYLQWDGTGTWDNSVWAW